MRIAGILVAILAALLTLPVMANDPAPPGGDAYGLWRGTVGKQDVMMVLGSCGNSYYYLRHLQEITLDAQSPSGLDLQENWGGQPTGRWTLQQQSRDVLEGTWTSADGKHSVPIRLKRVSVAKAAGKDCEGYYDEYVAPLIEDALKKAKVAETKLGGGSILRSMSAGNDLNGFEITPGRYNVPKLNAMMSLRSAIGEYYDCQHQAQASGNYFRFSVFTEASGVGAGYILVASQVVHTDCGSAHPDDYVTRVVWDLATDQPIYPGDWIAYEKSASSERAWPKKLLRLIEATANEDHTANTCDKMMEQRGAGLVVDLSPEMTGLVFSTPKRNELASDDTQCYAILSFAKLAPYLTAEGKKIVNELQRGKN